MPRPTDGLESTPAPERIAAVSPNLWAEFVDHLDPQAACELLGIEHFPHYLASAANLLLLAQHLAAKYGPNVTVREALVAELKAGPHPPSGSEDTYWWKEIEPHIKEWETLIKAFMIGRGALEGEDDD